MKKLTLDADEVANVRHMLLIGLASYGEVERLHNAQELSGMAGEIIADDLRVLHPTGNSETVSEFAEALRALEYFDDDGQ